MTEFGRYLKQCPAALKDKTRTLSLLKDALKNDLPKFRVLQAAYELGILEAIQRSNPISTDDRLKITTGLVSQYAMLENAAKNAIDYWQDSVDGANQRGFSSVCSTKAASEAGRNQSA